MRVEHLADGIVLHLGDATELLPSIKRADAIVCDPPYAIPTIVAQNRETTRNVGDLSLIESAFRAQFREFARILGTTGRSFVFCDGVSYPVVFRAAYGDFTTALLVWDKGRIGMGREFRKRHELLLHAWRPELLFTATGLVMPTCSDSTHAGMIKSTQHKSPLTCWPSF